MPNRVIIRIWSAKKTAGHVGHVSIEIKHSPTKLKSVQNAKNSDSKEIADVKHSARQSSLYMSLWPGNPSVYANWNSVQQSFEKRVPFFVDSYNADLIREGGKLPEFVVCLYSLNVSLMKAKFNELKEKIKNWTLLGEQSWNQDKDNLAHSCASFALEILKAGGIDKLLFMPESAVKSFSDERQTVRYSILFGKHQQDVFKKQRQWHHQYDELQRQQIEHKEAIEWKRVFQVTTSDPFSFLNRNSKPKNVFATPPREKSKKELLAEHQRTCKTCQTEIPQKPQITMAWPTNGMHLYNPSMVVTPADIKKLTTFAKGIDLIILSKSGLFDSCYGSVAYKEKAAANFKKFVTQPALVACGLYGMAGICKKLLENPEVTSAVIKTVLTYNHKSEPEFLPSPKLLKLN